MKKSLLTLFCLLICLYTIAQDTAVSRIATFALPKKFQKLNKQQYLEYGKKNFNYPFVALPNDHVYLSENLLITIRDRETEFTRKKTLEQLKAEVEGVFSRSNIPYVQSEIITVNGRRFYIFKYFKGNEGHLSFYTDYIGNKNKNIITLIDFKQPDEVKAQKHMDDLIKNMRFTYDTID